MAKRAIKRKRLSAPALEGRDLDLPEAEGPKRGRPASYRPDYANIAKVLCSRGATDADLADAFSMTTTTIQNWMSKHPDFGTAVREGKAEVFDPKVERALAQRAIGYSVDVEEVKVTKDGDEVRYQIRKHFPPDTTAAIFWLKNRQPEKWRDVWKIDHNHKNAGDQLSAADLLDEIRKEAAELGLLPVVGLKTLGIAPVKPNGKTTGNGTKH